MPYVPTTLIEPVKGTETFVPLKETFVTRPRPSEPASSFDKTFPETVKVSFATNAPSLTATGPSSRTLIVIVVVAVSPSRSVAVTPNTRPTESFGLVGSA